MCAPQHTPIFDYRALSPGLLPSPQILVFVALAASSLLIVLRMYVSFWVAFAKLTEAIRIAIWDRKTIIVAFATSVWGVNVSFLIQGNSLPPSVGLNREPYSNVMWYQVLHE